MSAAAAEIDASPVEEPTSHLVHSVMHFMRIMKYRKGVMFGALVVAIVLAGLYYITATRFYSSTAQLLILQTGSEDSTPSMSMSGAKRDIMPTYEQLLRSTVVIEGAIAHLAPEDRIDFEQLPQERWDEALAMNLSSATLGRTNIMQVSYRSRNPEVAARVVQAIVQSYLEFIDRTHKGTAAEITQVLTREKVAVEQQKAQRKRELLEARRVFGDLGLKRGGERVEPYVQTALKLNDALIEAQQKRLAIQSNLSAIQGAISRGEDLQQHAMAVEGVLGREILLSALGFGDREGATRATLERELLKDRAELNTLMKFYGPAHPEVAQVTDRVRMTEHYLTVFQDRVNQRLAEMRDTQLGPMLVQMMQQALSRAWQEESAIRESFELARQQAVRMNGNLAQLEIMEHDLERLSNLEDVLIKQIANINLQQEHGDIRAALVQAPVAVDRPVSPRKMPVAMLALTAAMCIGGTIVYVLDTLDDRFRSPDELKSQLGVSVLAMVREFPPSDKTGLASVQTFAAPDSVETEAFRTLRTALAFSGSETHQIMVSSAEPSDGKSTIVINLAVALAQAGKRVLVVDADLRRPGLTKMLEMRGQPGLFDMLSGSEPFVDAAKSCLQSLELPGLDFIPAGHRRPNPSDLMTEMKMTELLAWAEANYDQVLVDTPPVLAASETLMIGRLVDGVLLVVSPEKNHRHMVIRAVENFTAVGVNLLGIVANRISVETGKAYGYGYGYGYEYQGSDDEAEESSSVSYAEHRDALDLPAAESAEPDDGWDDAQWEPVVPRRAA